MNLNEFITDDRTVRFFKGLTAVFVLLALLAVVPLAAALSVLQIWWEENSTAIADELFGLIAWLQARSMGVE
jgi:hypothetical protein